MACGLSWVGWVRGWFWDFWLLGWDEGFVIEGICPSVFFCAKKLGFSEGFALDCAF